MLLARFMQVRVPVTFPGHFKSFPYFIIPVESIIRISLASLLLISPCCYSLGFDVIESLINVLINSLGTSGSGSSTFPGASSIGGYPPSFPHQSTLLILSWMDISLIAVASIKAKISDGDSVPTHMSQVPAAISPVPLLWDWGYLLGILPHSLTP